MPFPAAHPAAVLPVSRLLGREFPLSALVIGSIVPDLAMFFPIGVSRPDSHSALGLVLFCLPVGLSGYAIFHGILKRPLVFLLPRPWRVRIDLQHHQRWSPARASWSAIVACIALGAVTHVLWDSFTHPGAYFVRGRPSMYQILFQYEGYTLWTFGLLQHASTLLGAAVIAGAVWRWQVEAEVHDREPAGPLPGSARMPLVALLVLVTGLVGLTAGVGALGSGGWLRQLRFFVGSGVIAGGQAGLVSLVAYSLAWLLREKASQRSSAVTDPPSCDEE